MIFSAPFFILPDMKRIVYILVVIALMSCKTNTVAQEQEPTKKTKPAIVEKPKFDDVVYDRIDPSTVHIVATIMAVGEEKTICSRNYKDVVKIKIDAINGSGQAIINLLSIGQEIELGFVNKTLSRKVIQKDLTKDKQLSMVVIETLCQDFNQTTYEIVSYGSKK